MLASRSLPLLLRLCLLFHLFLTWCQRMNPSYRSWNHSTKFCEESPAHGTNFLPVRKKVVGPALVDFSPGAGTDSRTARIHSQFSKLFPEMVLITTGGNQKSFPPVSTYYPVYPAPQPQEKFVRSPLPHPNRCDKKKKQFISRAPRLCGMAGVWVGRKAEIDLGFPP